VYNKEILVIGQTPPPYGGQAMMIKRTLDGNYGDNIRLFHIRMSFSKEMDEIGKFSFSKIFGLFSIVFRAYKFKMKYNVKYLYFFHAGPNLVPILRDLVLLALISPLNLKKIFHFRAGGISTFFTDKSPLFTSLVKFIYGRPVLSIRLSEFTPDDHLFFKSEDSVVLYNGLEDQQGYLTTENVLDKLPEKQGEYLTLCFLGILKASKGVTDILKMVSYLPLDSLPFKIKIVLIGYAESPEYKSYLEDEIKAINCSSVSIEMTGVLTGKEKVSKMNEADIFIFPSYFEAEGLPGSVIEMMSLEKPIISSRWRGIPSLVIDSFNGFLVDIKRPDQLAAALRNYLDDPKMIRIHGRNSRKLYLEKFTMDKYYANLKNIFQKRI
jgi:glycosyltransferase involved in cell wall biosynthesis